MDGPRWTNAELRPGKQAKNTHLVAREGLENEDCLQRLQELALGVDTTEKERGESERAREREREGRRAVCQEMDPVQHGSLSLLEVNKVKYAPACIRSDYQQKAIIQS